MILITTKQIVYCTLQSAWPIKNSFSERCFREASSCQQFINRLMSGLFTNEYLASHTRTSSKRRNFNEKKKPMDSAHVEEIMGNVSIL
jgi:hypothetical protein